MLQTSSPPALLLGPLLEIVYLVFLVVIIGYFTLSLEKST